MKRAYWIGLSSIVLLSALVEIWVEQKVPGYYALFGFAGCVIIILFSKALGKFLLLKKEEYYDVG